MSDMCGIDLLAPLQGAIVAILSTQGVALRYCFSTFGAWIPIN